EVGGRLTGKCSPASERAVNIEMDSNGLRPQIRVQRPARCIAVRIDAVEPADRRTGWENLVLAQNLLQPSGGQTSGDPGIIKIRDGGQMSGGIQFVVEDLKDLPVHPAHPIVRLRHRSAEHRSAEAGGSGGIARLVKEIPQASSYTILYHVRRHRHSASGRDPDRRASVRL